MRASEGQRSRRSTRPGTEEGETRDRRRGNGGKDWWISPGEPHCADPNLAPFMKSIGGRYFPINQPNNTRSTGTRRHMGPSPANPATSRSTVSTRCASRKRQDGRPDDARAGVAVQPGREVRGPGHLRRLPPREREGGAGRAPGNEVRERLLVLGGAATPHARRRPAATHRPAHNEVSLRKITGDRGGGTEVGIFVSSGEGAPGRGEFVARLAS